MNFNIEKPNNLKTISERRSILRKYNYIALIFSSFTSYFLTTFLSNASTKDVTISMAFLAFVLFSSMD